MDIAVSDFLKERLTVAPRLAQQPQETRKALEAGLAILRREGEPLTLQTGLKAIVWRLLQEAAETLKRLPDPERVWLTSADRAGWPEVVHTAQEHYEAELQRVIDLKEDPTMTRMPRLAIMDPTAVNRMLTVMGWLTVIRGRKVKRDKFIVLALAGGMSNTAARVKYMRHDKSDSAIAMVKQKVLSQIEQELRVSMAYHAHHQKGDLTCSA